MPEVNFLEEPIDGFLSKQSRAKNEWAYKKYDDIKPILPYVRPALLREVYEHPNMEYWSNEDDFSFFQYVGKYDGRKVRVIFYNSSSGRVKISFDEWVKKGEYSGVRITLD